jgi:hypothetical protein
VIEISVDPRELIAAMNGMERQLPFATARALNETAVAFQQDERDVMRREFTIRRPWVEQGIKINRQDFATKAKPEVTIRVDQQRDFLNKFEQGGMRMPRAGKKALSIPIGAKPNPRAIVKDQLRPKALDFKQISTQGGTRIFKGANRTFLIQRPDGRGVILQRKGRKVAVSKRQHGPLMKGQRRDYALVVLYVLRPRTPVPADLHFQETARKSFGLHWNQSFTKWWNEAVRTANTSAPTAQAQALPAGFSE